MKHKDILALYKTSPHEAVKLLNNPIGAITELQGAGEAPPMEPYSAASLVLEDATILRGNVKESR